MPLSGLPMNQRGHTCKSFTNNRTGLPATCNMNQRKHTCKSFTNNRTGLPATCNMKRFHWLALSVSISVLVAFVQTNRYLCGTFPQIFGLFWPIMRSLCRAYLFLGDFAFSSTSGTQDSVLLIGSELGMMTEGWVDVCPVIYIFFPLNA